MNSQWQRQQKQQQEQQRRMQQAAWQQQKQKERQMVARASQSRVSHLEERFAAVESEAERLRAEFKSGRIDEGAFQARLQELLVQDSAGVWWMVGSESGRWYKYDGAKWVPGTPPVRATSRERRAAHTAGPAVRRRGSAVRGILVFVIGLAISGALFFAAGSGSYNLLSETYYDIAEPGSLVIAGAVGLIGLVITIRRSRQAWRGY